MYDTWKNDQKNWSRNQPGFSCYGTLSFGSLPCRLLSLHVCPPSAQQLPKPLLLHPVQLQHGFPAASLCLLPQSCWLQGHSPTAPARAALAAHSQHTMAAGCLFQELLSFLKHHGSSSSWRTHKQLQSCTSRNIYLSLQQNQYSLNLSAWLCTSARRVPMSMAIFTLAFNHYDAMLGQDNMGNCTAGLTFRVSGRSQELTFGNGRWLKLQLRTMQSSTSLPCHPWWWHTSTWSMHWTCDRTEPSIDAPAREAKRGFIRTQSQETHQIPENTGFMRTQSQENPVSLCWKWRNCERYRSWPIFGRLSSKAKACPWHKLPPCAKLQVPAPPHGNRRSLQHF